MIDDDDIEAGGGSGGQRLVRRGAAVDGNDERHAVIAQAQQRLRARSIALAQTVRHVEPAGQPTAARKRRSSAAEVAPSTS